MKGGKRRVSKRKGKKSARQAGKKKFEIGRQDQVSGSHRRGSIRKNKKKKGISAARLQESCSLVFEKESFHIRRARGRVTREGREKFNYFLGRRKERMWMRWGEKTAQLERNRRKRARGIKPVEIRP